MTYRFRNVLHVRGGDHAVCLHTEVDQERAHGEHARAGDLVTHVEENDDDEERAKRGLEV